MSVDYKGVGGIGVLVTDSIRKKLVIANDGNYDGCVETLLCDLGIECEELGEGNYTGNENTFYMMVEGKTLIELNKNVQAFIKKLKSYKINIKEEDIKLVSGLLMW